MTDINVKPETRTILVVEDEGLLRDMERSILEGCGYRVLDADSSRTALELWKAEEGKIDLLLADIVLPCGISGMELAKKLLRLKPDLKIIFITGRILSDLDQKAFEKLNARFLQKPYQGEGLIQAVKEMLNGFA
jgi:CheY-like chemotaxis protein